MKNILLILISLPITLLAQTSYTINAGMPYFNPNELNISVGDTVYWINDGGNHNVNFDLNSITGLSFNNPESFVSTPTTSADIFSYIFTIAGTYYYDCSVYGHASAGMTGKITVNSMNSINEKLYTKKILNIIDLSGKFSKQKNQLLFYIYDDGTVEKRIVIE